MNEASIIINGVRYDAVEIKTKFLCEECDLLYLCEKEQDMCICVLLDVKDNKCFKKSDKKFEK